MLYEKTLQPGKFPGQTLTPTQGLTSAYSDHAQLPDSKLWDAFKKGDEDAFVSIYNLYYRSLLDYGSKYTPDKEMIRDCLQDFFLYLRKNRLGFGQTNSIRLYLFKAFRRRIIDYLKKSNRVVHLEGPFDFNQFPAELSIEAVYINKQVKAEQIERLNKALNALDRKERAAIYYFYYKGLSYEQITEIFQFTHVSSARRVMYRGLRQLRSFFSYS